MTSASEKRNPKNTAVPRPLFFLRGPIAGGGDWQSLMAKLLFEHDRDIDIACPSTSNNEHLLAELQSSDCQKKGQYVLWEPCLLRTSPNEIFRAACAIYWLPLECTVYPHPGPEQYDMNIRHELGKLTAYLEVVRDFPQLRGKFPTRFVIGGDNNFHGLRTILSELSNSLGKKVPFYEDIETCVQHAFVAVRQ